MTDYDPDFEPEHEHLLDDGTLPEDDFEADGLFDDDDEGVDPLLDEVDEDEF
ncbi:MAG TPA: hypothetical protein VKY70_11470 [Pseudomonas sp.]|nr:hypothetical protein [Pseudomonas sp.]